MCIYNDKIMFLNFQTKNEKKISKEFLEKGYTIQKIEDLECYNKLLNKIYKIFSKKIKPKSYDKDKIHFFNNLHKYIKKKI